MKKAPTTAVEKESHPIDVFARTQSYIQQINACRLQQEPVPRLAVRRRWQPSMSSIADENVCISSPISWSIVALTAVTCAILSFILLVIPQSGHSCGIACVGDTPPTTPCHGYKVIRCSYVEEGFFNQPWWKTHWARDYSPASQNSYMANVAIKRFRLVVPLSVLLGILALTLLGLCKPFIVWGYQQIRQCYQHYQKERVDFNIAQEGRRKLIQNNASASKLYENRLAQITQVFIECLTQYKKDGINFGESTTIDLLADALHTGGIGNKGEKSYFVATAAAKLARCYNKSEIAEDYEDFAKRARQSGDTVLRVHERDCPPQRPGSFGRLWAAKASASDPLTQPLMTTEP